MNRVQILHLFLINGTDLSESKCSQLSEARPVLNFYTLFCTLQLERCPSGSLVDIHLYLSVWLVLNIYKCMQYYKNCNFPIFLVEWKKANPVTLICLKTSSTRTQNTSKVSFTSSDSAPFKSFSSLIRSNTVGRIYRCRCSVSSRVSTLFTTWGTIELPAHLALSTNSSLSFILSVLSLFLLVARPSWTKQKGEIVNMLHYMLYDAYHIFHVINYMPKGICHRKKIYDTPMLLEWSFLPGLPQSSCSSSWLLPSTQPGLAGC